MRNRLQFLKNKSKPLKRFRNLLPLRITGLKPGVNETRPFGFLGKARPHFINSCDNPESMVSKFIFLAVILLPISGCAHWSDPCDDKLLQRIPSPDGSLVLSIYERKCRSMIYTTAALEKPAGFLAKRGEVVCYVMAWSGGRYAVNAGWKDGNNISIGTPDRLEKMDFYDSKESCAGIKISYHVQFRNEEQTTEDPEAIAKLSKALSEVAPCINKFYQAAYAGNDPAGEVSKLIEKGEHRSALENLLGYTHDASCAITPETYQSLKELSETFDLKPGYLERVKPLVKQ